jgi:hypothetical protein
VKGVPWQRIYRATDHRLKECRHVHMLVKYALSDLILVKPQAFSRCSGSTRSAAFIRCPKFKVDSAGYNLNSTTKENAAADCRANRRKIELENAERSVRQYTTATKQSLPYRNLFPTKSVRSTNSSSSQRPSRRVIGSSVNVSFQIRKTDPLFFICRHESGLIRLDQYVPDLSLHSPTSHSQVSS